MAQSELYYDDDFEDAQGSDLVKKLRAKIDEVSKHAKELEKENSSLKAGERKRNVASVLESKGYNPKISAFIPADLDPTEDNLVEWLTEYGDVFGGPLGQPEQDTALDNSSIQAQRRMSAVEASGQNTIDANDLTSRIKGATTEAEVLAALQGL